MIKGMKILYPLKKRVCFLLIFSVLLTGCGKQEENTLSDGSGSLGGQVNIEDTSNLGGGAEEESSQTGVSSKDDAFYLITNRNMIFDIVTADFEEPTDRTLCYVGMQFYQGEAVLLYVKPCDIYMTVLMDNGEYEKVAFPNPDCGLYAYTAEGGRNLLIPGESLRESLGIEKAKGEFRFYYDYIWYVSDEGECYCTPVSLAGGESYFLKIDQTGQLCYKTILESGFKVEDFCCINGDMYVVVSGNVSQTDRSITTRRVVQFNPETGILAEKDVFKTENKYSMEYFGEGSDGLYMYNTSENGILKVNMEDGSTSVALSFSGGSHSTPESSWNCKDFMMREDGSAGLLYLERSMTMPDETARGLEERITLVQGRRTNVTLRAAVTSNWLKEQAAAFNQSNDTYWIVIEELSTSTAADLEDYANQTNVALSAGNGPDILCGNLIEDYVQMFLDKGIFLELSDRMEADGIRKEDYLPAAFSSWGDGETVYGINFSLYPTGYKLRGELLGITDVPDIQRLMDSLFGMDENATYYALHEPVRLFRMFLEGSEDLWGTVDWERGVCDFSGELFAQILENAKSYGYDASRRYQTLARTVKYNSIYQYDSHAELEAEGMVMAGVMFNDGCYGAVDFRSTLAINAASPNKEGAWEFLCYLLGEEAQAALDHVPVNKASLDAWIEKELKDVADGKEMALGGLYIDEGEPVRFMKSYTADDMTEERVAEYLEALENVRVLPYRTKPILDIICEEAGAYFSGSKNIKDVTETMQNRVQLYLDEYQ